jgi:hypothetical protein
MSTQREKSSCVVDTFWEMEVLERHAPANGEKNEKKTK